MKNKIFMYLFIFTLLILLFQFVNSKNIYDDSNDKVSSSKEQVELYKDSIAKLKNENFELSLFKLENNDASISVLEKQGLDYKTIIPLINDSLHDLNAYEGEEHPLIPYVSMNGGKVVINTVRTLNHKWIIADYTDGQISGELLIKYEFNDKSELNFKLLESFIYPLN